MKYSIVIPSFNEAENIPIIFGALDNLPVLASESTEVIFVDDGSTDNSWNEIVTLHNSNKHVKGIRLSKNCGHQYALYAGLAHASGQAVITMDADLQHPPNIIPELIKAWENGNEIVHTIRIDGVKHGFFKKLSSRIYYKVFSWVSGIAVESGMADFRLLDHRVVDDIVQYPETAIFLRGIVHTLKYATTRLTYQCNGRAHGKSKYTVWKMLQLSWAGITAFSVVPLRIAILVGFITSTVAFTAIIYALWVNIFTNTVVQGWMCAVAIIFFIIGILFILMGIIGVYIDRIFIAVKCRPLYLVADKIGDLDENPVRIYR